MSEDNEQHYATVAEHEALMRKLNDVISFNAVGIYVRTKSGKLRRVRFVEEEVGRFIIVTDD